MEKRNFRELSLKISKNTGIPIKKILDFLFFLRSGNAIENSKLLNLLGVSKNALNRVKLQLREYLKGTSTNTQLREPINDLFNTNYKKEEEIWSFLKDEIYEKSERLLIKYKKYRPQQDRNYDQFNATIETSSLRTSLFNFFGDIEGKNILFLGDDDFVSVTTAGLHLASNVSVLDIDKRIISKIKDISGKENLDIQTYVSDIRSGLSSNLQNRFDFVFTDPPYTENGVELFLSRAIQSLNKSNNSGRIYLCYGNSDRAKHRYFPIYEMIVKSGLMIRWVFDKFNRYDGAETIGNSSSLFVLDATEKTNPLISKNYEKPIYTNN